MQRKLLMAYYREVNLHCLEIMTTVIVFVLYINYGSSFKGLNLTSAIYSIISCYISLISTLLLLHTVKPLYKYLVELSKFYFSMLQVLTGRVHKYFGWVFVSPDKPHPFLAPPLQSDLTELANIIASINHLLPQLSSFIEQFNNIVTQSDVNVITDTHGNMSIDVPANMSDTQAQEVSQRLGVIDRLINTHGSNLNDLFQKGLSIENKTKLNKPEYTSQLTEKISVFKRLNASYKH